MSVTAYVLIQTEVGRSSEITLTCAAVAGVVSANEVIGPYDVIVRARAEDVEQLGRLVVSRLQAIPGITRTLTCSVIDQTGF